MSTSASRSRLHGVGDFGVGFTESDHDAALGEQIGPQVLGGLQHSHALIERCPRVADFAIEPRHTFDVVCEDGKRNVVQQTC